MHQKMKLIGVVVNQISQAKGEWFDDPLFGQIMIRDAGGLDNPEPDLKGMYCNHPWEWLEVQSNGNVFMCCATWLTVCIGNWFEDTWEEIWNGPKAQRVRETILDGSFKYCSKKLCPVIQSKYLRLLDKIEEDKKQLNAPFPNAVNFSNDPSCNISCPSCRRHRIQHNEGPEYERIKQLNDELWDLILAQPNDRKITAHITGSGDPWGSKVFREKLLELDLRDKPHIRLKFKSNGVMLTEKIWNKMWRLHNNIDQIGVSWDAATEPTYTITRREGDFKQLQKNMRFINDVAASYPDINFHFDFVVQADNYHEIHKFVDMKINEYPNARHVMFTVLSDWGTWFNDGYEKRAVWKETHPWHKNLMKELASVPPEKDKWIHWANFKGLVDKARVKYVA